MPSARVITFFGQLAPLLFRELRHGEQVVVHERVIPRHLPDLALSHAVGAAVTDVADEHLALLAAEERAHHGRAHAVELARARAALDDLTVGEANAGQQAVLLRSAERRSETAR